MIYWTNICITNITCERWQRSGPIHPTLKTVQFTNPFSSASPWDILHVGNLDEVVQCFLYSLHPREIRRQSSSTRCGTVKLLFLVTAPRGKPERQMKEMEHRSGTSFSGEYVGAAEGAAQHQQHFTNPFSSASPWDILHVACWKAWWGSAMVFSSTAAAAQQQQYSSCLLYTSPSPRD